ncbi:MAG TPA: hypothetical protein DHV30_07950, partial [Balneola sp.]|nr:hypothetical protein [Balneola sp.]
PIEKAIPLGLLINEVIVNSYKHAFKELNKGTVSLSLKKSEQDYYLIIKDNGVGFSNLEKPSKTSKSLGMKLIKTLTNQLKGTLDLQSKYGDTS